MKLETLCCIILFMFSNNYVQDSLKNSDQKKDQVAQTQIGQQDYYRILLEKTEQQNKAIMDTFYWSIGSILTILIAIIGTSLWYNYRYSNKEVENIIIAAERKVDDLEIRLKETIRNDFDKFSSELKNEIKQETENNLSLYKEQLKNYNKAYDDRFSLINENLEGFKDMQKTVSNNLKQHIDFSAKVLENDIYKNSGRLWYLEGVKGNALSSFIRSATIKNDLGWETKYILNDITKVLNEMDFINTIDKESLFQLLSEIKDNEKQKNIIKERVGSLEVYDLNSTQKSYSKPTPPNVADTFNKKEND